MPIFRIRSLIGKQLFKSIFGIYFMVTVLVTALQLLTEYSHTEDLVKENLQGYETAFLPGLRDAVWHLNLKQLGSILDGMIKLDGVIGIEVKDPNGAILASAGITELATRPMGVISHNFAIYYNDEGIDTAVGSGAIYTDRSAILKRLQHGFLLILLASIVKSSALCLIFLVIVRRIIANPVQDLTKALADMLLLDQLVCIKTYRTRESLEAYPNEIGILATGFFKMRDSLQEQVVELMQADDQIRELNKNLEHKVKQRTQEISVMLHSLKLGIFAIGEGGFVLPKYSSYMTQIFDLDGLTRIHVRDLLFRGSDLSTEQIDMAMQVIELSIGDSSLNFILNAEKLPTTLTKEVRGQKKSLEIEWNPVEDSDEQVEKIIVSIRDVTEIHQIQSHMLATKEGLDRIGRITSIRADIFQQFIDYGLAVLAKGRTIVEQRRLPEWTELLRNLHTLKGNARSFNFLDLSNITHEVESIFFGGNLNFDDSKTPIYLGGLARIEDLLLIYKHTNEEMLGRREMVRVLRALDQTDKFLSRIAQSRPEIRDGGEVASLLDEIRRLNSCSFNQIILPIVHSLPDLARDMGQQCPQVELPLEDFYFEKKALATVQGIFVHLIRNSLDHGLSGREHGKIAISGLRQDTNRIKITYRDNGRGLNMKKLREKGQASGCLPPGATDEDVANSIFKAGLSTADEVTSISGRGIGMNAVLGMVRSLGGEITITLDGSATAGEHQAFSFEILLPVIAFDSESGQDDIFHWVS